MATQSILNPAILAELAARLAIRFRVDDADALTPTQRRAGCTHAVIDGRYPNDGGPVLIAACFDPDDADRIAAAMNLADRL